MRFPTEHRTLHYYVFIFFFHPKGRLVRTQPKKKRITTKRNKFNFPPAAYALWTKKNIRKQIHIHVCTKMYCNKKRTKRRSSSIPAQQVVKPEPHRIPHNAFCLLCAICLCITSDLICCERSSAHAAMRITRVMVISRDFFGKLHCATVISIASTPQTLYAPMYIYVIQSWCAVCEVDRTKRRAAQLIIKRSAFKYE